MWIKTQAYFKPDISDVEWDLMDDAQKNECGEPTDFRFNSDDVLNYNKDSRGGCSIRFRPYEYSISITMTMKELDAIMFVTGKKDFVEEISIR